MFNKIGTAKFELVVEAVDFSSVETVGFNLFSYLQVGRLQWLQISFMLLLPDLTLT